MAFLELNGITVPVTNATMRRKVERRGKRSRSFRGALRDSKRGLRRQWDLELCFPDYEEGEAFIKLFQGEGHFFDLAEGYEGSTSLYPVGGMQGLQLKPNVWGARGRGVGAVKGALSGPTTPDGFFRVNAQLGDDWTVLWAEKQSTNGNLESSHWDFFAKRSDGVGYFSGAREDRVGEPSVGWTLASVDVSDGELTMRNDFSTDFGIDDILILPWRAPESWMDAWTTISPMAPKLPAMPVLTARGDFVEEDYSYVVGDINGVDFIQKPTQVQGIGWVNNAMLIRARLSEVDPAFYCVDERLEETVLPPGDVDPVIWLHTSNVDERANATLDEGDNVSTWFNAGVGSGFGSVSSIDAAVPVYRERGQHPLYRAPVVQWGPAGAVARLRSIIPAALPQPYTALCVYRSTDAVGTATQYITDGAVSTSRLIFRIGSLTLQQVYAGTFLGTGNTATVRNWNVGIAHINGANSQYRWNGSDTFGTAGAHTLQGITLGGLTNSTGSFTANGDLVELLVIPGSPGVGGVPTIEQLEQYVIDRYLEGG